MSEDNEVLSIRASAPTFSEAFGDELMNSATRKLIFTGEELLRQEVSELPCLLHPLLPKTGLACLAGSSDTGKSTLLRQLAIAVSMGRSSFLDFSLDLEHQSAIYVSTEDDETAVAYLLKQTIKIENFDELASLRFLFDTTNLVSQLDKMLMDAPASLVIIDSFADIYGSDLKDTSKIRSCLHFFQHIALKHKCLILFLHHTGKRTEEQTPSKNNLLGGQGFEAKMRLVIELRIDRMNPSIRHMCIVKGNYLPPEYKQESFVLHFDGESRIFSNTGERQAFDSLSRKSTDEERKVKYEKAKSLREGGKTLDEIKGELGFQTKSGVSKLLNQGKIAGW